MSTGGLSRARLGHMHDVMAGCVERGDLPGLVTLISRRGEVHADAIGTLAVGGSAPMRPDTIFRISSMTKPILAVAAMILVEECKLRLDEPVDRLLPELADRAVLRRIDGPLDETVPANRSITPRDLLTQRMGFGCIMDASTEFPIERAERERELMTLGPETTPLSPDEWIRRFATLPLMHQPGEKWMYNTPYWVLGVLIARAADQPLATFLRRRIFEPLGMHDTGFSVPPEKIDRLASYYEADPDTGALHLLDGPGDSQWGDPPASPPGSGELVSTAADYLAFGQMMLNRGKVGGERILSRLSVEAMTTDQLTPEQKAISPFFPGFWDNRGWGFGVSMITRRDSVASVPGRYGWDGGYGTSWSADPAEEMTAMLMTQVLAFPSGIYDDFWTSAYQAIDD